MYNLSFQRNYTDVRRKFETLFRGTQSYETLFRGTQSYETLFRGTQSYETFEATISVIRSYTNDREYIITKKRQTIAYQTLHRKNIEHLLSFLTRQMCVYLVKLKFKTKNKITLSHDINGERNSLYVLNSHCSNEHKSFMC